MGLSASNFQERAAGTFQTRSSGALGSNPVKSVGPIPLAAADTAGGVLAWANPEGRSIIVTDVILDVTTVATGACTLDAGVAANGTTLNDTIIDGVDVHTAVGCYSTIDGADTNGKPPAKATSSQYVTVSVASGASAGLVGNAYIRYIIA